MSDVSACEVFDAVLVKPILNDLTDLLDAKACAVSTGATRSQFDLLVDDGIIAPALKGTNVKAIWNPCDGWALIENLLKDAVQIQQVRQPWIPIPKSAQRLKIGPDSIIKAIQDGKITHVGNLAHFDGYASVHVDHEEVVRVLGAATPDAESIETFAKAVGIRQPSKMRRLIINGHTPATAMQNPKTRVEQHYLTTDDTIAFHSKFMTPRTMAEAYGRSWQSIGAELKSKGIMPFSLDGNVYGSLFFRSDVTTNFQ